MNIKSTLLIFIIMTSIACKNEIEINAPYKEIAAIYCFLNQNEPYQYLRIEKLYQNSATSTTAEGAQHTDSLYFDSLVVKIINIVSGDTFDCLRIDTVNKEAGFFSNQRNTLYLTQIPQNNNANEVYKLLVIRPKSNTTFTSQTALVKDAIISFHKLVIRPDQNNQAFSFEFKSGKNAAIYDLIVRYQYKEMDYNETNPDIFEVKTVDYYVSKSKLYAANQICSETVNSKIYVDFLSSKILPNDIKLRKTIGFKLITIGGTQDFANYLTLTNPSLSLAQKKGEYSNISNALGIFSSRNITQGDAVIDATSLQLLESTLPNFKH